MAKIWIESSQRWFETYDQTWHAYYDRETKRWLRVAADDPRGTFVLAVKGSAVDVNHPLENYPLAPKMTDAELKTVLAENAKMGGDQHRRGPRFGHDQLGA